MGQDFQQQVINNGFPKEEVTKYGEPWPFPKAKDFVHVTSTPTGGNSWFEQLFNESMHKPVETIKTFKPDRAPPRLLTDTTEGIHPNFAHVVDPSYQQPDCIMTISCDGPFTFVPSMNNSSTKLMSDSKTETDPSGLHQNAPGAKVDFGKNRVWLCIGGFSRALEEVAKVTTVGAAKYTPNGWTQVSNGSERYMDAFGRHLIATGKGEIVDDGPGGTNCLHKAQMIWNLLASLELDLREQENVKT